MKAPAVAAIALLLFLLAANIYRASVTSLTIDEGWTRVAYVDHPFAVFNSNHHILNTYAMKACVTLLGDSEFSLRLPSLLGGLLFMLAAYFLSREVCGPNWNAALLFAALVLNPFQLEYMTLARGYGMGCAFLLWTILFFRWNKPLLASLCMGLAVSSHLAMAFPCFALGLVAVILWLRKQYSFRKLLALGIVGPIVLLIIASPLLPAMAQRNDPTIPEGNWVAEGNTGGYYLISDAIAHTSSAAFGNIDYPCSQLITDFLAGYVLPIILLLTIAYFIKRLLDAKPLDAPFVYTAHFAVLCLFLAAVHVVAHLRYPGGRFGLYFYPLLLLMAAQVLRPRPFAFRLLFLALILIFAIQFHIHGYNYDQQSEGIRESVQMIPTDRPAIVYVSPSANTRLWAWMWYGAHHHPAVDIVNLPLTRSQEQSGAVIFVDTKSPLPPPGWTRVYDNPYSHFMLYARMPAN